MAQRVDGEFFDIITFSSDLVLCPRVPFLLGRLALTK